MGSAQIIVSKQQTANENARPHKAGPCEPPVYVNPPFMQTRARGHRGPRGRAADHHWFESHPHAPSEAPRPVRPASPQPPS